MLVSGEGTRMYVGSCGRGSPSPRRRAPPAPRRHPPRAGAAQRCPGARSARRGARPGQGKTAGQGSAGPARRSGSGSRAGTGSSGGRAGGAWWRQRRPRLAPPREQRPRRTRRGRELLDPRTAPAAVITKGTLHALFPASCGAGATAGPSLRRTHLCDGARGRGAPRVPLSRPLTEPAESGPDAAKGSDGPEQAHWAPLLAGWERSQHGIAEAQHQLGWKGLLKSLDPTYGLTPPRQLDHGTKFHIQSFLKHLHVFLCDSVILQETHSSSLLYSLPDTFMAAGLEIHCGYVLTKESIIKFKIRFLNTAQPSKFSVFIYI